MEQSGLVKRGVNAVEEGLVAAAQYPQPHPSSFPFARCPQANSQAYFPSMDPSSLQPLTLPEIIMYLAREGQCVRWDGVRGGYEVIDGALFEKKIIAAKNTRGNRRVDIPDHVLSAMPNYYIMLRGEQWGASGSLFRPKGEVIFVQDPAFAMQAQIGVREMANATPSGPYASFSENFNGPSTFYCGDSKKAQEGSAKRPRPSEDNRTASTSQQPYPLAVSFSDALCPNAKDKMDHSNGRNQLANGSQNDTIMSQTKAKIESESDYRDDDKDEGWIGGSSQGSGAKQTCLRLPELIDTLAKEGQVLRWDEAQRLYEVLDGPIFEEKFNALRFKRGKRREEAQHRPFARMHIHFILVRGDKWGGTGSAFRPKGEPQKEQSTSDGDAQKQQQHNQVPGISEPAPAAVAAIPVPAPASGFSQDPAPNIQANVSSGVSADMVQISLKSASVPGSFSCTLQHFLDVTGAGDFYSRCITTKDGSGDCSGGETGHHPPGFSNHWHGGAPAFCQFAGESDSSSMYSGFSSSASDSPSDGSPPDSMLETGFVPDKVLNERDIASIVGNMWHENSLGDQAYFFPREAGAKSFRNGAIVALVDGKLKLCPEEEEIAIYMVVSDNNAKWKGEPIPSPEEEKLGHWCAFLGQVPVYVHGTVRCGEYIGPATDGSGFGVVTALGDGPVVGIALASKETEGLGAVRTLCFAGFNALTPLGADFKRLFHQARELQSSVDALKRNVEACEHSIHAMTATVDDRDEQLRSLRARLEVVEGIAVPRAGSCGALDAAVMMELERHRTDGHGKMGGGWYRVMSGVLIGALFIGYIALAGDRGALPATNRHVSRRHHSTSTSSSDSGAVLLSQTAQTKQRLLSNGHGSTKKAALFRVSSKGSETDGSNEADASGLTTKDIEPSVDLMVKSSSRTTKRKHHHHHHHHHTSGKSSSMDTDDAANAQASAPQEKNDPEAAPAKNVGDSRVGAANGMV